MDMMFLVLHIEAGGGTIHALAFDANKPDYFVRQDDSTCLRAPRGYGDDRGARPTRRRGLRSLVR
jgi:hypothetical protein